MEQINEDKDGPDVLGCHQGMAVKDLPLGNVACKSGDYRQLD